MGPRPFSRGNPLPPSLLPALKPDFNGATAFQPWKHQAARYREQKKIITSMGPRPFSRGNKEESPCLPPTRSLQWGHGLSAVETGTAMHAWLLEGITSMGPRPFSRGNEAFFAWLRTGKQRLQWGHGLSAVETDPIRLYFLDAAELQWGHGLSAVETAFRGSPAGR